MGRTQKISRSRSVHRVRECGKLAEVQVLEQVPPSSPKQHTILTDQHAFHASHEAPRVTSWVRVWFRLAGVSTCGIVIISCMDCTSIIWETQICPQYTQRTPHFQVERDQKNGFGGADFASRTLTAVMKLGIRLEIDTNDLLPTP